jgi:MSHA biogenesis protein MshI
MLRFFKKALSSGARVGVMQDGARVELAVVQAQDAGRMSLVAENLPCDGDSWPQIDNKVAQNARASVVLGADAYSLQLIEAPNVPDNEMQEAVRWRIQHLIEFPVEEAAIETFEMPAAANQGSKTMIYAVIAHRDEISRQLERSNSADLSMDVIEIPELCIRNIAVCLPQDANGVAFLHFTDDCGYLTITRRGVLYMIRRIESRRRDLADDSDDALSPQELAAGVSLEVQRSLDYYESHYDSQPITNLVLGPGNGLEPLAATLADNLGITVSRLRLDDIFDLELTIDVDVRSDCLLAIGAALRSATATNTVATL